MRFDKMKVLIAVFALVAIAGGGVWFWSRDRDLGPGEEVAETDSSEMVKDVSGKGGRIAAPARRPGKSAESDEDDGEEASDEEEDDEKPEPMTEEERLEAEAEARVDAFDALTDRWSDQTDRPVTMEDVDKFAAAFRALPEDRRDECVHRALNLVPDENALLLAGILMDKEMGEEIVETVFNDILNRDEEVKKPILEQIFKDKSHPCWKDVAWILDVTDDLPAAAESKQQQ